MVSDAQARALKHAHVNGGVVSAGNDAYAGRVVRISARALDALIRRGLGTHRYNGDGGYAMELTAAGANLAKTLVEGAE